MLSSLARYLEPLPDEEGDAFLTQIQTLFQLEFIAKQLVPDQQERECVNISSQSANSEGPPDDYLFTKKKDNDRRTDSDQETSSTTVLHMGSVLSDEHDYLLWNPIYLIVHIVIHTFIWSMDSYTGINNCCLEFNFFVF